jgi:hypothetical protein
VNQSRGLVHPFPTGVAILQEEAGAAGVDTGAAEVAGRTLVEVVDRGL